MQNKKIVMGPEILLSYYVYWEIWAIWAENAFPMVIRKGISGINWRSFYTATVLYIVVFECYEFIHRWFYIFKFRPLLFPNVLNSSYKFSYSGLELLDCPVAEWLESESQSTHRVAMTTFWSTVHHDGKISPPWWGGWRWTPTPFNISISCTKL